MNALEFLKDYFNEDEYFIIAQKYPKIDDKVKHHHSLLNTKKEYISKQLDKFYYLNKYEDVDIYFSLNTYKQQKSFYPSRKEQYVDTIKSFYFDIDKGDIEAKKEEIIKLCGHPTYIIESSKNKFQFIYKFKESIVVDETIKDQFKKLLKSLIYHFDIDKTFDIARIFRLCTYMNKKPHNDNFVVTVDKYEYYYTFEEFEKIATPYILKSEEKPKIKKTSTITSAKKTSPIKTVDYSSINISFSKYYNVNKIINRKYRELLKKYDNDKSTADLAYAKWLRYSKHIKNDEIIIKKIFEARGYEELMGKHGYQIEYYLSNILEKSQ